MRLTAPISRWPVLWLAALLLVAYTLPWLKSTGAAITFDGYDLAEWVSLHPLVRGGNPPLLPTLLLRLPLACVALLLALLPARMRASWIDVLRVMAVCLLSAAQLPPLEFFTISMGDINYQQQFALAFVSFFGGVIGLFAPLGRIRPIAAALTALIGAGACILGLIEAERLVVSFRVPSTPALGGLITGALFALVAGLIILRHSGKQKE
jgi:hypothetical protein